MKKKFVWLITSCLIVALILASCAPAVVEEKEVKGVVKEPEKKAEKVEEVVEKEGPQYGGWANEPYSSEIATFDPIDAIYQTESMMDYTNESGLRGDWYVDRDFCDYSVGYSYRNIQEVWFGGWAESWEVVDPLTYVWKVRKGNHWHNKPPVNGREFVADDVVKTFERLLAAPRFQTHKLQAIETVTAPDKYTVKFELNRASYVLLMEIGQVRMCAHEVWEKYGDLRHWTTVIGTGPFTIEDFVLASSFTFERNPNYWEKDPQGNQLPFVDGVRVFMIPDDSTILAALKTGKLDKAPNIPWTQKDALEAAAPELEWKCNPLDGGFSMWLKNSEPPFNNLKVRQAVSMAIDRKAIAETLFPPGVGLWHNWPAKEAWPGIYIPYDELPPEGKKVRTYDPVAAKALLTEAGYPNGFNTSIQYYVAGATWAWCADGLAMIKEWWADIGIDLELRPVDAGTMSSLRYAPFPYDDILGVGGGQASPFNLIDGKYHCGAAWNRGIVCDPYIDEIYDKLVGEFDVEKRNALYKDVFEYILEQATDITLSLGSGYLAWWPWVKGYSGEGGVSYGQGHVWSHIWLDQDLREEMTGRR